MINVRRCIKLKVDTAGALNISTGVKVSMVSAVTGLTAAAIGNFLLLVVATQHSSRDNLMLLWYLLPNDVNTTSDTGNLHISGTCCCL